MKKYNVILSGAAEIDVKNYIDFITNEYSAPLTALRHANEIKECFLKLESMAGIFRTDKRLSLLRYGLNVRTYKYKKMSVIYTIYERTVFVHRLIPSSTIL